MSIQLLKRLTLLKLFSMADNLYEAKLDRTNGNKPVGKHAHGRKSFRNQKVVTFNFYSRKKFAQVYPTSNQFVFLETKEGIIRSFHIPTKKESVCVTRFSNIYSYFYWHLFISYSTCFIKPFSCKYILECFLCPQSLLYQIIQITHINVIVLYLFVYELLCLLQCPSVPLIHGISLCIHVSSLSTHLLKPRHLP